MATQNNQKEDKKICSHWVEETTIKNNIKNKLKEWELILFMFMEQL
jgi:hypothetical protein